MASVIESGLGLGKLVKFSATGRFNNLTSFSNSLKIGYKAGGTRNNQAYKIVTLLVTNIGGITKGEFRINQVRKTFLLATKTLHHDHTFRINKNGNGKSFLKRKRIFISTPLHHPTIRNG